MTDLQQPATTPPGNAVKEALLAAVTVLKKHPMVIGCIFFATEFFSQYFMYMGEALRSSFSIDSSLMILNEVGTLMTGAMAEGTLLIVVPAAIYAHERGDGFNGMRHVLRSFNQIFIESIRALASVIRWGVLLLIPGFYKHIRYVFVPYIVLIDPEYEAGKVDALHRSSQLTSGRFTLIVFVIMFFSIIDYAVFPTANQAIIFEQPLTWALKAISKFSLDILFCSLVYVIFRNALAENRGSND